MSSPIIRNRPNPSTATTAGKAIEAASDMAEADAVAADARPSVPDYAVGFCRPPLDTRFGASRGNRSGRKKGEKTLDAAIKKELDRRITVNVGGKQRTLTKLEVFAANLVNAGIAGKPAAQRMITNRYLRPELGAVEAAQHGPMIDKEQLSAGETAGLLELLQLLNGSEAVEGDSK